MDLSFSIASFETSRIVSSRKGGVDLSKKSAAKKLGDLVSSRKGGVDLSLMYHLNSLALVKSPPAREEWI